ncbi:MAG TPA: hypothetical protein VN428_05505, partial [Bryobacteraceae bacterium]|nr:hypothetical protein [Bryobacteraceae bacterium]
PQTLGNSHRVLAVPTGMRRLLPILFLTGALFGADLTGRWTGMVEYKTPDGEPRSGGAFVMLKHDGDAITGKAGPTEDEAQPISNAKFDGQKLILAVTAPNGNVVRLALNLVEENKLEGTMELERESGEKATGRMVLRKQ